MSGSGQASGAVVDTEVLGVRWELYSVFFASGETSFGNRAGERFGYIFLSSHTIIFIVIAYCS